MVKLAKGAEAPAIKGKETQKTLFAFLCIIVAIYAIVITAITLGETILSGVLMLIIFGFTGGKNLMGRNLFKWEYAMVMAFSAYALIANSVWTIPNMLDLIWYEGWRWTILLEPLIANFVFLALILLGYNLAFRNAPFRSWTS
jgi:hypothetical protein